MTQQLDLADIQGNILQDFVSGYPKARFILLRITDAAKGRRFIYEYRSRVTTAVRWSDSDAYDAPSLAKKPRVAINLAISFPGLVALGLPTRTLSGMPAEFIDGMKKRAAILGDDSGEMRKTGEQFDAGWDKVWRDAERPHLLIGLNALLADGTPDPVPELAKETAELEDMCKRHGLVMMGGHGPNGAPWQDCSTKLRKTLATYTAIPVEHFGFADGISNPVFEGQHIEAHADAMMAVGNGKIVHLGKDKAPEERWAPLATGEILLGHPDEAQEIGPLPAPAEIFHNGTFLVYRKLHENVGSFRSFISKAAADYAAASDLAPDDAAEVVMAKIAGRWSDGVSVAVAPTFAEWKSFNVSFSKETDEYERHLKLVDFRYGDDPEGLRCPVTSHMRRANPRDNFEETSALNNRRRILRRGIPYGETSNDDTGEHGIIFLAMCANLGRQYEFVQQQWINYGLDSFAGNDTCPLVGNRSRDDKFVLPVDPKGDEAPFVWGHLPKFVEMRGGEYFFLPSMTALRMIGMGTVDPT